MSVKYDMKTSNPSFYNCWNSLRDMNTEKDPIEILQILDPSLIGVDIKNMRLIDHKVRTNTRKKLFKESSENIWHFFRDILRLPSDSGTYYNYHDNDPKFTITPYTASIINLYNRGVSFIIKPSSKYPLYHESFIALKMYEFFIKSYDVDSFYTLGGDPELHVDHIMKMTESNEFITNPLNIDKRFYHIINIDDDNINSIRNSVVYNKLYQLCSMFIYMEENQSTIPKIINFFNNNKNKLFKSLVIYDNHGIIDRFEKDYELAFKLLIESDVIGKLNVDNGDAFKKDINRNKIYVLE